MKQKQSYFSLSLFWEGVRQCRTLGVLTLVILVLGAILDPLSILIYTSNSYETTEGVAIGQATIPSYNAWEINPFLILVAILVPVLALVLFRFLNNRSASDFYHALPHKRVSLYLSFAGAILFWLVLLVVVSTGVSTLTSLLLKNTFHLVYSTIIPFSLAILAMGILLLGGVLLAMSLTGTLFSNVLFSGILLFLPRTLYTVVRAVAIDNLPMLISSGSSNGFFRNSNNLVFETFASLFDIEDGASIYSVFSPAKSALLYTILLGLVYLALGCLAFRKRRSEAAGQAAPTRFFQHFYRILVTMSYCSIITALLYEEYSNGTSKLWFSAIVLYLIGILISCIYELITTKKFRNLLSTLPGLGIVALLNIALALGLHGVESSILSKRPATEEIESVSFLSTITENQMLQGTTWFSYSNYVGLYSQDIPITDETVREKISYALNQNIEDWEKDGNDFYTKYWGNTGKTYTDVNVAIKTKTGTLYRCIYLDSDQLETIRQSLQKEEAYVNAWKTLPTPIDDTLNVYCMENSVVLSDEAVQELFQIYNEEFQSLSFEEIYDAEMYSNTEYNEVMDFQYLFRYGKAECYLTCSVYEELMPKTVQTYFDLLYQQEGDGKAALEKLEEEPLNGSIYFAVIHNGATVDNADELDESYLEACTYYSVLKPYFRSGAIQAGDAYVIIEYYAYDPDDSGEYAQYTYCVPLDDALFESDSYTILYS